MTDYTITEGKVLPFQGYAGRVPGHAILRHDHPWLGRHAGDLDTVESVAFWHFDREADMAVETLVHWTRWTQYAKRVRDRAHTIKAVILRSGRRVHATTYSVRHHDEAGYLSAPILARDTYRITTLIDRETLLEVAGVGAWANSQRRPDDAALILDPWERDNAEWKARTSQA